MRGESWFEASKVEFAIGAVYTFAGIGVFSDVLCRMDASAWAAWAQAIGSFAAVVVALSLAGRADRREDGRNSAAARIAALHLLPALETLKTKTADLAREANYTTIRWDERYKWTQRYLEGGGLDEQSLTFDDDKLLAVAWLLPRLPHDLIRTIGDLRELRDKMVEPIEKFGDRKPDNVWPHEAYDDYRRRFTNASGIVARLAKETADLIAKTDAS